MSRSRIFFIFFLLWLQVWSVSSTHANPVKDFRNEVIDRNWMVPLDGTWAFYWDRLLMPGDFHYQEPPGYELMVDVPAYWTTYTMDEKHLPGQGHATYRLSILLPPGFRQPISFDVPVFDASYRLFLDDQLVAQNGIPGTSESTTTPGYAPNLIQYTPTSDTLHILVQVANYHHRRGGFWKTMRMGHPGIMLANHKKYILINYLSLGVLAAFSLFFLVFSLMFRKDQLLLFFSLTLLGIFIRLYSTEAFPMLLFSSVNWSWLVRHEYMGSFMAFLFGSWFFYKLYPSSIIRNITRINTGFIGLVFILILFFDVDIFAYSMWYFQPAMLLFFGYYWVLSFIKTTQRDRGSILYFSGLTIFILALVNDILLANSRSALTSDYVIHFAVQIFVLLQAIMLMQKWIYAFNEKERLHAELEYMNRNLEKLVKERTNELERRNKEINKQNEQIAVQNRSLQESLDFKNKVFSIIAHDLRSPIASLAQISSIIDHDVSEEDQKRVLASAKNLVMSASDLIDNLLYWGRSQGNQITCHPALTNLADIVDGVVNLFEAPAGEKSITLHVNSGNHVFAWADRELIKMVVRNLVSNAIKFTPPQGDIYLNIENGQDDAKEVRLIIRDTGIGMDEVFIDNFFQKKTIITRPGTNHESGTGLGLHLCYDLVQINNGKMHIESEPHKGTTVTVTLPSPKSN
jgi:signal transduction histidine kinase